MLISSKGEYGSRALLDLALHYGQGLVQTGDMAGRLDLPKLYLDQLIISLRNAGLVTSKRGSRGGHVLARPPAQISLAEAIIALEGSTAPIACVDEKAGGDCNLAERCTLRPIWQQVKRATDAILEDTSLEDLCRAQKEMDGRAVYHI